MSNKKKLELAYRIIAKLGLDDHTYTHLSCRSDDKQAFHIHPMGLRFEEVEEKTLIKANLDGKVIEGQEDSYNITGYIIHKEIYKKRPDINAIFHLHSHNMVAVSSVEGGLMPINQWALHFYNQITYSEYDSLALVESQGEKIAADLKEKYIILLKHHGVIICGKTIEEAMFFTHHLEQACKTQILTLSMGRKVNNIAEEICQKSVNDLLTFEKNLGQRDWQAWVRWLARK